MKEINMNGLYSSKPMLEKLPSYLRNGPYHCHNWTFRPLKRKDGSIVMVDTYYGMDYILVTEENRDLFELIFDFNDVQDMGCQKPEDFKESDIYRVAIGSGGISNPHYFLKKTARPDKETRLNSLAKKYALALQEVEFLKEQIKSQTFSVSSCTYGYEIYYEPEDILSSNGSYRSETEAWLKAAKEKADYGWINAKICVYEEED